MLGAVWTELVQVETVSEGTFRVSAAADSSWKWVGGGVVLDVGEGCVDLESASEVLGGFCVKSVEAQTASESYIDVSAGADSRKIGDWGHT